LRNSNNSDFLNQQNVELKNIRLGLVISKRYIKKSVSRNLIKRWVKELLKDSDLLIDIIIKVNRPVLINSKDEKMMIFNEIKHLLFMVSA
jgi:ribonuclease P protein component